MAPTAPGAASALLRSLPPKPDLQVVRPGAIPRSPDTPIHQRERRLSDSPRPPKRGEGVPGSHEQRGGRTGEHAVRYPEHRYRYSEYLASALCVPLRT